MKVENTKDGKKEDDGALTPRLLISNGCRLMSDIIVGFVELEKDIKIFLKGGGEAIARNVGQYEYHILSEALEENTRRRRR